MTKKHESTKDERETLAASIEEMTAELAKAERRAEHAEAQAQVEKAADLLAQARAALVEAERLSGDKWRERLAAIEPEIETLEAKEAQAVADLEAVEAERAHLETEHGIIGGSDRLRTRAQNLRSRLGKVRRDLAALRSEAAELTAKLV